MYLRGVVGQNRCLRRDEASRRRLHNLFISDARSIVVRGVYFILLPRGLFRSRTRCCVSTLDRDKVCAVRDRSTESLLNLTWRRGDVDAETDADTLGTAQSFTPRLCGSLLEDVIIVTLQDVSAVVRVVEADSTIWSPYFSIWSP